MIPSRKTFSISPWKEFDWETSKKSANHPLASVPLRLPGFVTVTSPRLPADDCGVLPVILVELTTDTEVAGRPPIFTVAPGWKFVPRIIRLVPAADGPDEGLRLFTAGPAPGVPVGVRVGVGVAVAVGVRVAVGGMGVPVDVRVGVRVGVGVEVAVAVAVEVRVAVAVGGNGVAVRVGVAVEVAVAVEV